MLYIRFMASFLRNNGLTVAMVLLFAASCGGQVLTGHAVYDAELVKDGAAPLSLRAYLQSGHFVEAIFENWESEFLQMGLFVLLTKWLKQKGSSESKKLDEEEAVDEDPRDHRGDANVPWPARRGGAVLFLYERSLSSTLFLLFAVSLLLHAAGGARMESVENAHHGKAAVSMFEYIASSKFWFESFQNWQSEFLSVGAIIVLSIFLRERGSSQSKPVHAPHAETGE